MTAFDLTRKEADAIHSLMKVSRKWPDTLWLFSASGRLYVMKKNEQGKRAFREGKGSGVDPDFMVAAINIESDGGDW